MNQKQTILLSAIAIYLVVAASVAGGFAYTYQRAASDLNCTTVLDERGQTAGERIESLSQLLRSTERVIERLPAEQAADWLARCFVPTRSLSVRSTISETI